MAKVIIASGPVIVENNKVLLNKHGDTTFYKFCGGGVEDFTLDLAENAAWEVKEEMGIGIKILDTQPFVLHTKKTTTEGEIDVLLVHFLAQRIGEIKPGPDIREWGWFEVENLPSDLGPNIIPALKHFGFLR